MIEENQRIVWSSLPEAITRAVEFFQEIVEHDAFDVVAR